MKSFKWVAADSLQWRMRPSTSYVRFFEQATLHRKAERCYNEIGAPETKIKGILNILVLTPRAKISDPVLGLVVITPPKIYSTLLSKFVKSF